MIVRGKWLVAGLLIATAPLAGCRDNPDAKADLAPLDVSGYGALEEREAAGDEIEAEERALMQRALDENSVIVAQMTPFFD